VPSLQTESVKLDTCGRPVRRVRPELGV